MSKKKSKKSKTKIKTSENKLKYERAYVFENRVNRVLDLLRKTGIATKENCIKYSEDLDKCISNNRFEVLAKLKYIKKVKVINNETKEVEIGYKLNTRGKTYVKDHLDNATIYSSNSDFHDLKQSNFLFEHYTNQDIDTYKHEKELESLIEETRETSRPDGYLIDVKTGEGIYIETITKNYSKEKIDKKLSYCLVQNSKYHLNII